MATFTDIDQVRTYRLYKTALKTALGRLKSATPVSFVYLDKFQFDDKERILVLVDYQPSLLPLLPKKPTATGKCKVNAADRFVFESSGTLNFDKIVKLLADAGVPRAVAHPDDKPDAPAREPDSTQLNMRYGWTEMRTWGGEAQDLIDAFDGLVGAYRGLPEPNPTWKDLVTRQEEVKQAMSELARMRIANDRDVRLAKLTEVKTLVKKVRQLMADIRTRSQEASRPPPETTAKPREPLPQESTSRPAADKPPPPVPTRPQLGPTAKPALTADALQGFVRETRALGPKDTLEKYVVRARRVLEGRYATVNEKHMEVVERLAGKLYFAVAETSSPNPTTAARPAAPSTPVDWAERVVDTGGTKADLSGFDSTMRAKILEIAETGGRGHHGATALSGRHGGCLHWRLGDMRIFGNLADGKFTLIGTGRHSGKGNSNYKVDLLLGGTATATTA